MMIVAQELVLRRRLRRGSRESGMCADHTLRYFPPAPGDSPLSYASVVVGDILNQPIDGVVGIGALIDLIRTVQDRPVMNEFALRLEFAPGVLVDDDVPLLCEVVVRTDHRTVIVGPVRRNSVGCPADQNRILLRMIPRRVHDRKQFDTVAHWYHELRL